MRRAGRRVLVLASVALAAAAGVAAVRSALGTSTSAVSQAQAADATITSRSVPYGHARVTVRVQATGRACFRVLEGSSAVAKGCVSRLGPAQIAYASSRTALGGIAGPQVRAVILKLTRKGTVWATLRRGTFHAAIPKGHAVREVVKVLAGGSRETFTVTGSR